MYRFLQYDGLFIDGVKIIEISELSSGFDSIEDGMFSKLVLPPSDIIVTFANDVRIVLPSHFNESIVSLRL